MPAVSSTSDIRLAPKVKRISEESVAKFIHLLASPVIYLQPAASYPFYGQCGDGDLLGWIFYDRMWSLGPAAFNEGQSTNILMNVEQCRQVRLYDESLNDGTVRSRDMGCLMYGYYVISWQASGRGWHGLWLGDCCCQNSNIIWVYVV